MNHHQLQLFVVRGKSECHSQTLANSPADQVQVFDLFDWHIANSHINNSLNKGHAEPAQQAPNGLSVEHVLHSLAATVRPFGILATTPAEIKIAAQYAQYLYLPGEFCRQSDLLTAAAATKATILLERGALLSPADIVLAVEKLNGQKVIIIDAGSSFGYSDRVLDPRALGIYARLGIPFGIHLSQLLKCPGIPYEHKPQWLSASEHAEPLLATALALKASAIMLEYDSNMADINTVIAHCRTH